MGSNLGDRERQLQEALDRLSCLDGIDVLKTSSFYMTRPQDLQNQDWFLNVAVLLETNVEAPELLDKLLAIEQDMGRVRKDKWGPRVIDLDILFYGQEVIDKENLQVPHSYLPQRRFVLIPLLDIAPDWVHPASGLTPAEMLAVLPERGQEVIKQ
ncbi:MAG: 2-amino-4-hydroxy-6-hydroxymethyldihydropteridine diphosphokinase [Deltaproteobacteria bacterium]|nr:2-amino-4-hydroxy-6-hydroxymethyldihydropteridine diphosphokinase [Deltaproteobacteria bacterium]